MRTVLLSLFSTFLFLLLVGCERIGDSGYRYNEGTFPDKPLNLETINSPYDDYNSTIPSFGEVLPLVFSSKRGGRADFDFVYETLNYSFSRTSGAFTAGNTPYGGLDILQKLAPLGSIPSVINSSGNELGPYIRSYDDDLIRDGFNRHYGEYLLLFASDRGGNLDIYLSSNYQPNPTQTSAIPGKVITDKPFTTPVLLPFLNSKADDAYPTFTSSYDELYFTSNRGGTFDIYKAKLPAISKEELQTQLPALGNASVEKVTGLSSEADDKCPYIDGNTLVFTSNRPGGLGGFDLYYSKFENGAWTAPVNFGPSVNSAYDEYRPILRGPDSYQQKLLLFSSNRPGGKGGFDLYLVGVPK